MPLIFPHSLLGRGNPLRAYMASASPMWQTHTGTNLRRPRGRTIQIPTRCESAQAESGKRSHRLHREWGTRSEGSDEGEPTLKEEVQR